MYLTKFTLLSFLNLFSTEVIISDQNEGDGIRVFVLYITHYFYFHLKIKHKPQVLRTNDYEHSKINGKFFNLPISLSEFWRKTHSHSVQSKLDCFITNANIKCGSLFSLRRTICRLDELWNSLRVNVMKPALRKWKEILFDSYNC